MQKRHRSAAYEVEYSSTKSFTELGREYILECMDVDLCTGTATWKERPLHHFANGRGQKQFNRKFIGKPVGGVTKWGYWLVRLIRGRKQYVMRRSAFIWLMAGREINPEMVLDHINRVRDDDRLVNLRQCPQADNVRNHSVRSNSTTGVTGVVKAGNKYRAIITLGTFNTLEEASVVRREAELRYFGEFATNACQETSIDFSHQVHPAPNIDFDLSLVPASCLMTP